MRYAVSAFLVVLAGTASAQSVARPLTLVAEKRFEVGRFGQARDVVVGVASDGRVIATMRNGSDLVAFDSTGKTLGWKLAGGRRDEAEIMFPTAIGSLAGTSTVWVTDAGFRQVALVDASGKVVKSIEHPSWVHPHWAERRKYPVFASMEAVAMYPDHSMLILPGRERSLLDVPGYDRSVRHLLRISPSGAIEGSVASLPIDESRILVRSSGCGRFVGSPFAARTEWAVSGDGSRVVIVSPPISGADSGTFRVTAVGEHGDTLFSRRYTQPVARIPQEAVDRFLGEIRDCGTTSAASIRELAKKQIPTFRSFLVGVVAGTDGTSAITLRAAADSSRERTVQLIDAHGETIGTTQITLDQVVAAVSRDHLWVIEPGKSHDPGAIVRYRVDASAARPTAARPSRTVPVSSSSRPSRPPA